MALEHFRVCIIGAGPTGLTAIKNIVAAGIEDVICHEAQDATGGIWAFSNDLARPSVYETAHTITSKKLSQFPDYPMPDDYPDYPSNRQILAYMRAYEAHFELSRHIRLNSKVENVVRRDGGGWQVSYRDASGQRSHTADYLLVCSGHHREPTVPDLPGNFFGQQLHSVVYKKAAGFAGQRVLVVGGGNSACDIAAETSRVAEHVSLSVRSPHHIIPKLIAGRPVDVQFAKLQKPFFRWARHHIVNACVAAAVGPYARYGLQQPDFPVLSRHPTLNTIILDRIRHGKVRARPAITKADGNTVHFTDGTSQDFDTIVWATGFRLGAPFLEDICRGWGDATRLPLFHKMILADIPDIFFIGLIQPIGCIWVLADLQAKVAAAEILDKWKRPGDMAALITQQSRRDAKRYKASPRHAVQVDGFEYSGELKEILRSAKTK